MAKIAKISAACFTLPLLNVASASAAGAASGSCAQQAQQDAFALAQQQIELLAQSLRKQDIATSAALEKYAREASGIMEGARIDWQEAQRASEVLTRQSLIASELENADVYFVEGWLLTKSEAASALLFSSAIEPGITCTPGNTDAD